MTDNRSPQVTPVNKQASDKNSASHSSFCLEDLENRVLLSAAVNAAPTMASLGATVPSGPSAFYTLVAKNVKDDSGVAAVTFFRDSNKNGVLDGNDQLLGEGRHNGKDWTLISAPKGFTNGVNRFFAQATDDQGKTSTVRTATAKFNLATIGSFTVTDRAPSAARMSKATTASTVQKNTYFTLTVSNVQASSSVEFYRDVNGNGVIDKNVDTLLGLGTQSGTTWTLSVLAPSTTGTVKYMVCADDIYANSSITKVMTLKVIE